MTTHTDAPADDLGWMARLENPDHVVALETARLVDQPDLDAALARIRSLEASCAAYREQVITLDLMKASAEAQRDEAVGLLESTPVVVINDAAAALREEIVLKTYAASMKQWAPKARAFLDSLKEGR